MDNNQEQKWEPTLKLRVKQMLVHFPGDHHSSVVSVFQQLHHKNTNPPEFKWIDIPLVETQTDEFEV